MDNQNSEKAILSIVIGSYNRCSLLQKTVESIRSNNIKVPYEIIVVDGGSNDRTMEWLITQKDIITIIQHNRGEFRGKPIKRRSWGYFMNLGFKSAQGKYILMISDDCLLLPEAVNNGLDRFLNLETEGRKIGGVAFYFRNWPLEEKYYVQNTLGGKLLINHGIFLRKAMEEIGWADEDRYIFYKADGDLCLKIWEAGYEIADCPDAIVEHYYDPHEEVRQSNDAIMDHDRKAYLRRWEGIYYHPGKPDPRGPLYIQFEDVNKTAEKIWANKKAILKNRLRLYNFLKANLGLILLIFTAIAFHVMAYFAVKSFYSHNLPHYDSMGTYTMMFQIINTYHLEGFSSALNIALSYHLSWLQSFFALMGAPFLNTTPESVQLYNSLAVFLFMLSVYLAAKSAGAGEIRSYLLSLMVFLPDVFFDWQGGLLDLQRDPSFVLLLGATYFTFFAITIEPSFKKGILLGFFAGLTVLSRGNALFLLIAVMFPIICIWSLWRIYMKDLKSILIGLLPAAGSFLLVAGANLYYALLSNISRYQSPFVAYSIGDDAMLSIASHWSKPIQIMFGRSIGDFGGHTYGTLFVVIWGFLFLTIILAFLRYKGLVKYDLTYLFKLNNIAIILAGIWTIAITIFLMCFIIKLKPLNFGENKFPFYPSLLGFLMIFFVLGYSVRLNSEKTKKSRIYVLAGLLCMSIFVLGAVRLEYHTPEATPKYVKFAKEMAEFFTSQDKPKVIAFMWHDTISIDTLKFYLAEKGSKQPIKFLYTAPDGNQKLDFAVTAPPGIDIPALLLTMKKEIEDGADYIVLATKPGAYAIDHHMLLFKYGQPVVDSLMRSDKFRVVFTYELWGMPFAVLENKERMKII